MADQHTYTFLPEDQCLSESQLFDYIDGKLKATDMHVVEKHILSCGFCSDALEGLEKVKDRSKVAAAIPLAPAEKKTKEEPKVIPLNPNRKYYALAAGVVLVLGITFFLKIFTSGDLSENKMADLTKKDSAPVPTEIGPGHNKDLTIAGDSLIDPNDNRAAVAKEELREEKPARVEESYYVTAESDGDFSAGAPMSAPKATDPPVMDKNIQDETNNFEVNKNVPDANVQDDQMVRADVQGRKDVAKKPEQKQKDGKYAPAAAEKSNEQELVTLKENVSQTTTAPAPSVNATGATTYSSNEPTVLSPTGATPSYTWTGPASGSTVTVSDSTTVYTVVNNDRELDLSYENANKMLAAGQAAASLSLYDKVLTNPAHVHYHDAQWKKAEALLQLKRIDEAKKLLGEIAAVKGKYQEQAKAKLKTL
jgi:hypothetical protein